MPANSDADVSVVRNGESVDVIVNIGELPSDDAIRRAVNPGNPTPGGNDVLKLTVKPLDEEVRSAMNIDKGGVQVESVEQGGPAANAGIVVGDVISMVDNKPVDSDDDLQSVLREIEGRSDVAVLVHRREGPVFLALQLD